MKTPGAVFLFICAGATQAVAVDVRYEFNHLTEIASEYSGLPVEGMFCGDRYCEAELGPHLMRYNEMSNGRISADLLPLQDRVDTNILLCAAVFEYLAGLGPDGSALLAGSLFAESENEPSPSVRVGGALLTARRSTDGMLECSGWREQPLPRCPLRAPHDQPSKPQTEFADPPGKC